MEIADLKVLQTLLAVETAGSFAGAARALGLTRAAVSRAVADAEGRLGVRLCRRTTRRVVLSDAAVALLRKVEHPLEQIRLALEAAADSETRLSGEVRVTVSHAFGRHVLLPLLRQFNAEHPEVRFIVTLADTLTDLVATPVDIAVRLGPVGALDVVARRLDPVPAILCATPGLLAQHGDPHHPGELSVLPCIAFRVPGSARLYRWQFEAPGGDIPELPREDCALTVDSIEAVADLVKSGAGVGVLPPYLAEPELSSGRLRRVLPRFPMPAVPLNLLYYHRELIPPRVKALIAFLVERLSIRG